MFANSNRGLKQFAYIDQKELTCEQIKYWTIDIIYTESVKKSKSKLGRLVKSLNIDN